jgi:hypothetical protein
LPSTRSACNTSSVAWKSTTGHLSAVYGLLLRGAPAGPFHPS